eukprot:TRINITY_DN13694_c0_g1_i1.p1 TRINITY_DN13694_c0_g1~~TRINITY_DN13694_c0_g1_i1.p1  ORF type:complete len:416 (+),score=72.37 TRINITY_DN13694_c0_g1_i1:68-1315(+)
MKFTVVSSLCFALVSASQLKPDRHPRNHGFQASLMGDEDDEASFPIFMHTSDQIHSELEKLASNCNGASFNLTKISKTGKSLRKVEIDSVRIKGQESNPKYKTFILFGEHARELISAESGYHFIKQLCSGSEQAKEVLAKTEFHIVPNGNPGTRKEVEGGDYCKRVDPDGIDLNRNWDSHWQKDSVFAGADTYPGPSAFSEPETQVFKELVSEFNPNTFLTVHSGNLGMYMPWAFDQEHLANKNQPEMMELLQELDKEYCQCPFGAAGRELQYSCPGTCLDWVFSNLDSVQYAFAFEIYYGRSHARLKARWQEKLQELKGESSFLQMNTTASSNKGINSHLNLADEKVKSFFEEFPSTFVQLKSERTQRRMSNTACLRLFNPTTETDYQDTIENWSNAYFTMFKKIAKRLDNNDL